MTTGTDATMIIEMYRDGFWEPIGLIPLPRNYELFNDMRERGNAGYPPDIDDLSKQILEDIEDWGEGYMTYKEWLKLLKEYDYKHLNTIKKKYYDKCRVIYRFDC